jgi:hypothetical protein
MTHALLNQVVAQNTETLREQVEAAIQGCEMFHARSPDFLPIKLILTRR